MLWLQPGVVSGQSVAVSGHVLHHSVEAGSPADDTLTDSDASVSAGHHLADHFVDRKPVHLCGAPPGVAGKPTLRSAEAGQVAAADARGKEPDEHLAVPERLRCL